MDLQQIQRFPGSQELQKDLWAPRSGRGEIRKSAVTLERDMIPRMNDVLLVTSEDCGAESYISQRVAPQKLIWIDVF